MHNSFGVVLIQTQLTRGSSFLATPGFGAEPLRGSKQLTLAWRMYTDDFNDVFASCEH